jgi:hypothetical protein
MRHDRPTPAELIEAVREFIEAEILPTVDDHRLRFRTLVAANALAIAGRELESGVAGGVGDEELAELTRRIREGNPPDDALALLKRHVAAKVEVANPGYLERYE